MINYFNIFMVKLLNNLSEMQGFWWKFSFYFWKIFWWRNIVEGKNNIFLTCKVYFTCNIFLTCNIFFTSMWNVLHNEKFFLMCNDFHIEKNSKNRGRFYNFPKAPKFVGQRGVGGVFGRVRNFFIIAIFWVFRVYVLFDIYVTSDKFFCVWGC